MPREKATKMLSVDDLRYAEYYEMQKVFDDLYARSKAGEKFIDLIGLILSRENILLAYRNIKTNTGSNTAGTDRLTIKDIVILSILVDTFFTRISMPKQHPEIHSISVV